MPSQFRGFVPARHPALRYGIALNDAGYFWESHQVLETVWAAVPQGGRERILLRACIQIANANLKLRINKPHAAVRLFGEALGELNALGARVATVAGGGFADCFPISRAHGGPADKTGEALVIRVRLDEDRVSRPDMKKNADFGGLKA